MQLSNQRGRSVFDIEQVTVNQLNDDNMMALGWFNDFKKIDKLSCYFLI